jgi:hypothetical protein
MGIGEEPGSPFGPGRHRHVNYEPAADLDDNWSLPLNDRPSDAQTRWYGSRGLVIGLSICATLLLGGWFALKDSPESSIGPYGLIQALSLWYYIVIATLLLSLAWTLGAAKHRSLLLSAHLIVLVILVHGAPAVVESAPRFATAWLHAGFTDYVADNGKFLPNVDARFSWPSFFAGSALIDKAAGLRAAISLIRWWPVAMNLLYLPFIYRIANAFLGSEGKAWIATILFPLANWVGQDYYSPQSIALLLYLAFIFVLVGPLGADDGPLLRIYWGSYSKTRILKIGRLPVREGRLPVPQARERSLAPGFYLGVLVLLMAAMATGHQLTPIIATFSALILVLTGRSRVRWIVPVFALMTIGWVCYGAVSFWSGHFGMLLGGVGSVQSNVGSSVFDRIQGSFAHRFVVDIRLIMSLLVWLLAIIGGVVWRPRSADRAALVASFLVPFAMLAGGSYGGEAVLRVYLFALPFATCLIAALITQLRWPSKQIATGTVLVLLVPFFLVSRWGNELFELVRPNEITAVQMLYRIANPGSTLISITPQLPWRFADVAEFQYEPSNLPEFALESTPAIIQLVGGNPKGGYVIITTSQIVYGWQTYGLPETWGSKVERFLVQSQHFKLRYSNPNAEIFQYIPRPRSR